MIILWILNRNKNEHTLNNGDDRAVFQKHDEHMKMFRQAHPEIEKRQAQDISELGWTVLAPLQSVKLPKCVQN